MPTFSKTWWADSSATLLLGLSTCLALNPSLPARGGEPTFLDESTHRRHLRQANARPTLLLAPSYSVAGRDRATIYLLNTAGFDLSLAVAVRSESGERLALGAFDLPTQQHLALALDPLLRRSPARFRQGSLEVSFLGDPDAVQGWVVLRRGEAVLELPMTAPEKLSSSEATSFWDLRGCPASTRPTLHLLNAGPLPVHYTLVVGQGMSTLHQDSGEIPPGASPSLHPAPAGPAGRVGWLRFEHDGQPGDLVVGAVVEGRGCESLLPWLAPSALLESTGAESMGLPTSGPGVEAVVTFFNPDENPQAIQLRVLDLDTGVELGQATHSLGAGEVESISAAEVAPDFPALVAAGRRMRFSVLGEGPLVVMGRISRANGGAPWPDLAFFPRSQAHAGGTYPLPALADHEVVTTLVNLGDAPSEVVAQIAWAGGSYALGPISVPAGGATRLDLDELTANAPPDLLGRLLNPALPQGFLKWTVRSGSRQLIARTEARPRDTRDSFGFNCFGCCWETPRGEVLPSSVEFLPGQTRSFQACVRYDTCSGSMGPYPVDPLTLSVVAPFTWDGSVVEATGPGMEDLTFTVNETEVRISCDSRNVNTFGAGSADTCKSHLSKSHAPSQFWTESSTCVVQVGDRPPSGQCESCDECCGDIKTYRQCKRRNPSLVESEYQACVTHCGTDRCN